MLQISPEATQYLRREREERGLDGNAGARLIRKAKGTALIFTAGPKPGDRVLDEEVRIYMDEQLAAGLGRSIIDVRSEDGTLRLVLRPQTSAK